MIPIVLYLILSLQLAQVWFMVKIIQLDDTSWDLCCATLKPGAPQKKSQQLQAQTLAAFSDEGVRGGGGDEESMGTRC